jgi:signal transduction histidine kinase
VEVHHDPIEHPVEVDPEALGQAIVQLLTNAIRFTPDGGRVDVRVLEHDDQVTIEVQDTGVGISEDKIEAVLTHSLSAVQANHHRSAVALEFNSFGLGLGLAIARGIVEGHGGVIRATSREGEGSTFVIEIPSRRSEEVREAA